MLKWVLRYPDTHRAPVNVMVDTAAGRDPDRDVPVVWVFDPHLHADGVQVIRIKDEAEIRALVSLLSARMASSPLALVV